MAHRKTFEKNLDDLFKIRTQWLRSIVGAKRPGKPPKVSAKRDEIIKKLQKTASNIWLNKLFLDEFKEHAGKRKQWTIKGHGGEKEKKQCEEWFKKIGDPKNCIYAFFDKANKCMYVGRTGKGGCRPSAHLMKKGFSPIKIKVFLVNSASHLHKLECLAIHYFSPTKNKKKSAAQARSKKCPLCVIHDGIKSELLKIFKMKQDKLKLCNGSRRR